MQKSNHNRGIRKIVTSYLSFRDFFFILMRWNFVADISKNCWVTLEEITMRLDFAKSKDCLLVFCISFINMLSYRAEFCLIFRSYFGQWSFKKKCFWDLLTFITGIDFLIWLIIDWWKSCLSKWDPISCHVGKLYVVFTPIYREEFFLKVVPGALKKPV